jgi:hypothetical protein
MAILVQAVAFLLIPMAAAETHPDPPNMKGIRLRGMRGRGKAERYWLKVGGGCCEYGLAGVK